MSPWINFCWINPELVYLRDAERRVQGFSTQGKVLACEMIDGLLGLIEGLKP